MKFSYSTKSDNIDTIYMNICRILLLNDDLAADVAGTREMNNVMVELTDINNNIVSVRDISPSYLFGEWLWYFTGRYDTEFISKFGSLWSKLSDDGITANSAYGYLIKHAFGFNQIDKMIELLKADPNSRRAVININTPNERVIETKDEPCTIALQFLLRDGKLHCTAVMRSNDIYYGFPYDVAFFTEVQKIIADRLGVEYGTYTHFVTSLHMYDKDKKTLEDVIWWRIPRKAIVFDRNRFHQFKYKIAAIIASPPSKYSEIEPKELVLKLMEKYCCFHVVKEKDEHDVR